MIEKKIGTTMVQVTSFGDIKAGDIFRFTDNSGQGPLLYARADARKIPHPTKPGATLWAVKTRLIKNTKCEF
jgi:hypothetical protein